MRELHLWLNLSKKIIHPQAAEYSMITLIIIAVAVIVKVILGLYVKKQGVKVE